MQWIVQYARSASLSLCLCVLLGWSVSTVMWMYLLAHMWIWVYWSVLSVVNHCIIVAFSLSLSLSLSLFLSLSPSLSPPNALPNPALPLHAYTIHNMHTWTGLQLRRQRTKHLVQRLVSIGSFLSWNTVVCMERFAIVLRLSPFVRQCNYCGVG